MKMATDLRGTIEAFREQGVKTVREVAAALNALGIATPQGKQWNSTSVHRFLKRVERLA